MPAFAAGLVVITGIVVAFDLLTDTTVRLFPLLIFLPAIAAGLGSVLQTVIASVWVVLAAAGLSTYLGGDLDDNVLTGAFTAVFGALSVVGCRYRVRREEEVRRLRSAASALQQLIVRPLPLRTADVVVDGLYHPVEEEAQVGGDMYEVAVSRHGTRVLIADVQGKGLPAIGTALAVLGSFREAAYREPTLKGVVDALEKSVVRQNTFAATTGEPERLVTALVLDINRGLSVEAVNCGHIAPFMIHDGVARQVSLGDPSVPLGVAALTTSPRTIAHFAFPPGATLMLCTDGVTEARDPAGTFYPLEDRLRGWAPDPPGMLAQALGADLRAFTRSTPRDDIAILTLRRIEPGAAWHEVEYDGRRPA
ncbi:SpoIIE family protein phosphatase [Nonomuraea phyllanthi]|uniref:SpoIIE family protein phosphatase n=1 Tax=Nonomuraea phyllanthi TaxID=2219224 RepID=A0A5C4WQL8_9ACTN|nr:PP2C family protein-serine/threonine phosphatase [Nonomuraea phyllanthi]KAB8195142.1 SpoIIE family protein phosphatase [Nonomuraea phyllanthi]QFY10726.1 SpoIIE family protein phosphatase [Nonomuraea phyllanthi]